MTECAYRVTLTASEGSTSSASTASSDFMAVSGFLSKDQDFSRYTFSVEPDSMTRSEYPATLNYFCSDQSLATAIVRNASDWAEFADWLIAFDFPRVITLADDNVPQQFVALAGQRSIPLVLLRHDVAVEDMDMFNPSCEGGLITKQDECMRRAVVIHTLASDSELPNKVTFVSFNDEVRVGTDLTGRGLADWFNTKLVKKEADNTGLIIIVSLLASIVFFRRYMLKFWPRVSRYVSFGISMTTFIYSMQSSKGCCCAGGSCACG